MAATWTILPGYQRSVQSVQALTEAAPTLSTDGVLLSGVVSIVAVLTAPGGQTFTGAGTLVAYHWNDSLARWMRAPRADDTLADLSGLSEGAFPAWEIKSGNGRFAWIGGGVGVSGAGTTFTLTLLCSGTFTGGGAM